MFIHTNTYCRLGIYICFNVPGSESKENTTQNWVKFQYLQVLTRTLFALLKCFIQVEMVKDEI